MAYLSLFKASLFLTIIAMLLGFLWGGPKSLVILVILSILEISLSFDNAVLNAKVLHTMHKDWQKRFLTWGMLIAVFGVRLILPILIVGILTELSFAEIVKLAVKDPDAYSKHLQAAHIPLSAFGGLFLFMVFVTFIFNQNRSIHWLGKIEKKLSDWGRLQSIEIVLALLVLLVAQSIAPKTEAIHVLIPGLIGIILFIVLHTLTDFLANTPIQFLKTGLMGFLYLEVLDASFSFDGVMGAFAITKDIILIVLGLTVGAMFVRSMTLLLVEKETLQKYLFLEHGAHYAIGALSILMLLNIAIPVPEIITGLIGVTFIALSLLSSIRYNRKNQK